jgi:protein tyrosine/serine phosphatase
LRSKFYVKLAAVAAVFVFAIAVSSQTPNSSALSNVKIKNFGQMDQRFYRGAQPKESDYKDLAALGIKTVIDLRDDPTSYEKRDVEALGMRYVNIPMSDKNYPQEDQIVAFLNLAEDSGTGAFFVHCAGGRHRTGVVGAVYRFNHDHWTFDQAYDEMKKYDFYTRFGHGDMKKYVEDYWGRIQTNGAVSVSATTAAKQK